MRAYLHRGMVVLAEGPCRPARQRELFSSLRRHLRWHRKQGMGLAEAKRAAQVSVNHQHMPSKRAAQRLVDEAIEAVRESYPGLARFLVADWRQGHRRERGNVVLLSFWMDSPRKSRQRK